MKRRFWKSEPDPVLRLPAAKRLAVLFLTASLLAFSAGSCGLLVVRDVSEENSLQTGENDKPTWMPPKPAEQHNEVKTQEEAQEETAGEETETTLPETENTVSLTLAGGVYVDSTVCADAASRAVAGKEYSFLTMYSDIYPDVQNADMSLVTINTPAADTGIYGISTEAYSNMPPESVEALVELGFDVINVAGQNRMDCGCDGLRSTIDTVSKAGVIQIGAHTDAIDAGDVRVLSVNGIDVAFVAFSENPTQDADGLILHDLQDPITVNSILSYADLISDVVLASVSWDSSFDQYVQSGQREGAQMLANAGADIIIGSNGVCLQTAEWLEREDGTRAFAAYSLGNLLSVGKTAETVLGGLLQLDIHSSEEGTILVENIRITPVVSHYTAEQKEYQAVRLSEYSNDVAATHGVGGLSTEVLQAAVQAVIPSQFLNSNGQT